MRFGVLFRPQAPPDSGWIVERWQQVLEAAQVAEEAGFHGVFLPEHHMMADGYPPSPWAGLGAIASRTTTLELGTTVYLLPLRHPVHTAEAGAMLDIVSNGRLRLGCGLGNYAPEYELYGWNKRDQVGRFEEAIDIVRRAWAGEELDHEGRHFTAKGRILPLPVGAQLWLGGTTEPGVRRAARFGCKWVMSNLQQLEGVSKLAELYRSAGREAGTSDDLGVILLRDGFVADSLEDVRKIWWPSLAEEHWFYFSKLPRFTGERSGPTFEGVSSADSLDFDKHREDRLIVGSPEQCIEQIRRFEEGIGLDYLIVSFRMSRGPSHEHELEAIRRFGAEVIPAFDPATTHA
jgi:alkanesulfonate monooxygenase SsuD/methylene tetrahydromethanopterin reductase-like flavin-dependent oxidoreductase (luciferase family)